MNDYLFAFVIAVLVTSPILELLDGLLPVGQRLLNRWIVTRWLLRGLIGVSRLGGFRGWFTRTTRPWHALLTLVSAWMSASDTPDKFRLPEQQRKDFIENGGIERDLANLATGGQRGALYNLSPNQLAAQINAASEVLLEYRGRKNAMLLFSLAGVRVIPKVKQAEDFDMVSRYINTDVSFRSELERLQRMDAPMAVPNQARTGAAVTDAPAAFPSTDDAGSLLDNRARLTARIQRRLDDLQISTRVAARTAEQLLSLIVAVVVMMILTVRSTSTTSETPFPNLLPDPWVIGVAAGLLAPSVHDVMAAIRRSGGRS